MNDLISRQSTIDALVKLHEETGVKTAQAIRIVREMPGAQQWIPCSERLPEDTTLALVANTDGDVAIALWDVWIGRGSWNFDNVIAWMPLPSPYQGD